MSEQQRVLSDLAGTRITAVRIGEILDVTEKTARKRLADGLTAGDVIAICRAVDVNPVEALVTLRFVTLAEAMDFVDSDGRLLATADQEALLIELVDRMLTTTQLAEILTERTRKPVMPVVFGDGDTKPSVEEKIREAERAGLMGTPASSDGAKSPLGDAMRRSERRSSRHAGEGGGDLGEVADGQV